MSYTFYKGHGTENDFVILPDPDGTEHQELSAERVRLLCDRRAGIGGDGVLRALRAGTGRWFMDYRNSDGSLSEMCGNGVRVFALYLEQHEGATFPMEVETRDGVKALTRDGDLITVDMGTPQVHGCTEVHTADRPFLAHHVSMGNPHAVTFVENLDEAGTLLDEPTFNHETFPDGVNIEFVARRGTHHVAMRVHERGSGETRSCGTGACAVMVAAALDDHAPRGTTYRVDVPGGELAVTWTIDDRVLLTGPAVLVASGTTDL